MNVPANSHKTRRKPLFSNTNMAAQLRFAKLHLNKPKDFWSKVLCTEEIRIAIMRNTVHGENQTQLVSTNTMGKEL